MAYPEETILKILHRYLITSILLSLGMTLGVFTFVLLVSNIFKDILSLLSNQSVDLMALGRFFLLLMPFVLSFSLPMALLASTLLVMGRISADNELTAVRACGLSFNQFIMPVFGIASLFTIGCLGVNHVVAPRAKYAFNHAFVDIAFNRPISILEEGKYIRDFNNLVIYIGKRDAANNTLYDVRVSTKIGDQFTQDIYAEKGVIETDRKQLKLGVKLTNARITQRDPDQPGNLEKRRWDVTVAEYPIDLDLTSLVDRRRVVRDDNHESSWSLWKQVVDLQKNGVLATPKLVEIHKRSSLAMACISFVMIGLPLGIQVQRRETSIGLLVSLILAVVFYILILLADGFKDRPQWMPELLVWLPNLIFQIVGGFLLWKQSRI